MVKFRLTVVLQPNGSGTRVEERERETREREEQLWVTRCEREREGMRETEVVFSLSLYLSLYVSVQCSVSFYRQSLRRNSWSGRIDDEEDERRSSFLRLQSDGVFKKDGNITS